MARNIDIICVCWRASDTYDRRSSLTWGSCLQRSLRRQIEVVIYPFQILQFFLLQWARVGLLAINNYNVYKQHLLWKDSNLLRECNNKDFETRLYWEALSLCCGKKFRDDFSFVKMSCCSRSLVSLLFVCNGCELNCSKISESSWPLFPDACPGEPDIFGQNRFWKQGHVGTIFLYLLVWFPISEYSVYSASTNFQPGSVDRNGLFLTNIRHHPRLEKGNIFLKWAIFLCHSD